MDADLYRTSHDDGPVLWLSDVVPDYAFIEGVRASSDGVFLAAGGTGDLEGAQFIEFDLIGRSCSYDCTGATLSFDCGTGRLSYRRE